MALWKPDPTFYPSARMAMAAPPETLAYVVTFDPKKTKPDALCAIDLDPKQSSYGKVVGRLEMPKAGDELHHFGWNACSAALCPYAPHPHVERRYLVVPGMRSSRIYIIDTKPYARNPRIVRVIEPEEIASQDRLQPAAYDSLRSRRDLRQRARRSQWRRAGRNFPARSRKLRCARAVGSRSRPSAVRL